LEADASSRNFTNFNNHMNYQKAIGNLDIIVFLEAY